MTRTIWVKGPKLGAGSYGTVFKGITTHPNHPIIAVKTATYQTLTWLAKEELILLDVQGCDNVVRCLGNDITLEGPNNGISFNLFLEYAQGGTLEDLIKKSKGKKLVEREVAKYTRMILHGLRYVHGKGYVHCDLKPSNILVFEGNRLKIADFGLSKRVGVAERQVGGRVFKGTPRYMSPESCMMGEHEPPLDIWSLGCIVVEMITGKPLWSCTDLRNLYYKIYHSEQLLELPEEMSEMGKDFLKRCFDANCYRRWTAEMLLNHPFVAENPPPGFVCRDSLCSCTRRSSFGWIVKPDNEEKASEYEDQRDVELEAMIIRNLEEVLLDE